MGLGPAVCHSCKVLASYIPDENPRKQGDWVCPFNEYHNIGNLWEIPMEEQKLYLANTKFVNFVNSGHDKCLD